MKTELTTLKLTLILSVLILSGCVPTSTEPMEIPPEPPTQQPISIPSPDTIKVSEPSVTISPTSGASGTLVFVTATGFPSNAPVSVGLGPVNAEFGSITQGITDANGVFLAQIPVTGEAGMKLVIAVAPEGQPGVLAPDQFQIIDATGNPAVNISPTSGASGTLVYVTATGFPANVPVSVGLGPVNAGFGPVAQGITDANGVFLAQVPVMGESGMKFVIAVAPEGQPGVLAPDQFQIVDATGINPAVNISPTSGASGTLVFVTATGFPAKVPVSVGLGPINSELGYVAQGVTDANGVFLAQVSVMGEPGMKFVIAVIPEGQPGILATDQFQIVFAVPNPEPTPPLIATPTPYMDTWTTFSSPAFAVSLQYPADWQPAGYGSPETGEIRFAGINGFFHINSMDGDSIDAVAAAEAGHRLQPYGSQPTIENLQIQGQEARLILPSNDQPAGMQNQAALIVRYPQVLTIVWSPRYFVLWADAPHIRTIAETLRFTN